MSTITKHIKSVGNVTKTFHTTKLTYKIKSRPRWKRFTDSLSGQGFNRACVEIAEHNSIRPLFNNKYKGPRHLYPRPTKTTIKIINGKEIKREVFADAP